MESLRAFTSKLGLTFLPVGLAVLFLLYFRSRFLRELRDLSCRRSDLPAPCLWFHMEIPVERNHQLRDPAGNVATTARRLPHFCAIPTEALSVRIESGF